MVFRLLIYYILHEFNSCSTLSPRLSVVYPVASSLKFWFIDEQLHPPSSTHSFSHSTFFPTFLPFPFFLLLLSLPLLLILPSATTTYSSPFFFLLPLPLPPSPSPSPSPSCNHQRPLKEDMFFPFLSFCSCIFVLIFFSFFHCFFFFFR